MNQNEITQAATIFENYDILGEATAFLEQYAVIVNNNSDGWSYCQSGYDAASKMLELITECKSIFHGLNQKSKGFSHFDLGGPGVPMEPKLRAVVENKYKAAVKQINAFCVKRKWEVPSPKSETVTVNSKLTRKQIESLLSQRINRLDHEEVIKVFCTLFSGKLNYDPESSMFTIPKQSA
jgi:hypothetical protein